MCKSTKKRDTKQIVAQVFADFATHFAPVVENWVNKEYSATMQKWINEEFAPEQAKTITESVNKNVSDFLEAQQKDNKYSAIDDVLEKLSASVNDESVAQKILESQQKDKYANVPVVEGMPMNFRPLWEALDEVISLS